MFADGAGTTTKMVPEVNGGHILAIYGDYVEVFSKAKAETLPPHQSTDPAIELESGYNWPYGRIYNLSEFELRTLKAYIEASLVNGFTQLWSSPAVATILFGTKTERGLRLCVDCCVLNPAMVRNLFPLPSIPEMLDHECEARIFMELNLRVAWNIIRIKEGDEYKTAFQTHYSQFEYQVMPFCQTNTIATFKSYIDDSLRPYIDRFAACYLNAILIFWANEKQHKEHVHEMLQQLTEFGL